MDHRHRQAVGYTSPLPDAEASQLTFYGKLNTSRRVAPTVLKTRSAPPHAPPKPGTGGKKFHKP